MANNAYIICRHDNTTVNATLNEWGYDEARCEEQGNINGWIAFAFIIVMSIQMTVIVWLCNRLTDHEEAAAGPSNIDMPIDICTNVTDDGLSDEQNVRKVRI